MGPRIRERPTSQAMLLCNARVGEAVGSEGLTASSCLGSRPQGAIRLVVTISVGTLGLNYGEHQNRSQ
jgi:hypothetical protein